ncbi:ectonucleotide pyrophosphatase/phosphodiesterase [Xanthomonadaceae bacterium JHOS43]|nr:ectonucleotide pyrophosphatase/phosphodiesterase [Xanthomonadaceae bacterium JHOS43]
MLGSHAQTIASVMPHFQIRPVLSLLVALCMVALVGCQAATRPERMPRPPLLILVSIDGFRADYFDLGLTPTLATLADEGARVTSLRPSFPSLTFPNHYTLVTGLVPDRHGIVHNTMRDPESSQRFTLANREAVENAFWWNDAQPIWNTARQAGLRSATMFWPGSEAPVRGHHPHYWHTFDAGMTPEARVAQVLAWLDLPADQRPDFTTLYFDSVDHAGHVTGPDSPEAHAQIARIDAALAELVSGLKRRALWDETNLLVLSDHGMAATPRERAIALDDYIPRELFELVARGSIAGLRAAEGREAELETAMSQPIPHIQCWRKEEIPARFRYGSHRRVPPWVCMGDEGWTIFDRAHLTRFGVNPGAHGFDPALDSMAALFVAHGPDFVPGAVLEELDNVDVYPLLARLLRIVPEPHDGDAGRIAPLLRR